MARTAAAMHILVKQKHEAEAIMKKLKQGGDFRVLAKKHSICPSGKKGGDLGEFNKGQMLPAFDRAVFNGELLKLQLVKTKHGWHILKVLYRN